MAEGDIWLGRLHEKEFAMSTPVDAPIEMMRQFVHRTLEPWPAFVTALVVGSVAQGEARADSDVDCVFVFDPLDEAIIPAEFVWVPATNAYHTIFEVEASEVGGIQIDAKRFSLDAFRHDPWLEGLKHDLAHALVISDRDATVAGVLDARLAYPDSLRLSRIQDHLGWAEYQLEEWRLMGWIDRGGIASAHDQLTVAFEELAQLLHAYNREWLPWRYRWTLSTQRLAWLPENYARKAERVMSHVAATRESVLERHQVLVSMFDDTRDRVQSEGLLGDADDVFIASHPGLGYAHNFDDWRRAHRILRASRDI
jgi:hypothetical protein